jgi:hypothetical protein
MRLYDRGDESVDAADARITLFARSIPCTGLFLNKKPSPPRPWPRTAGRERRMATQFSSGSYDINYHFPGAQSLFARTPQNPQQSASGSHLCAASFARAAKTFSRVIRVPSTSAGNNRTAAFAFHFVLFSPSLNVGRWTFGVGRFAQRLFSSTLNGSTSCVSLSVFLARHPLAIPSSDEGRSRHSFSEGGSLSEGGSVFQWLRVGES